jgi:hypothetical protein
MTTTLATMAIVSTQEVQTQMRKCFYARPVLSRSAKPEDGLLLYEHFANASNQQPQRHMKPFVEGLCFPLAKAG